MTGEETGRVRCGTAARTEQMRVRKEVSHKTTTAGRLSMQHRRFSARRQLRGRQRGGCASLALYNTYDEVDCFIAALREIARTRK